MENVKSNSAGIGFPSLLALVFIVLKLTGFIGWSWWWVLSPLWIGLLITILILFLLNVLVSRLWLAGLNTY